MTPLSRTPLAALPLLGIAAVIGVSGSACSRTVDALSTVDGASDDQAGSSGGAGGATAGAGGRGGNTGSGGRVVATGGDAGGAGAGGRVVATGGDTGGAGAGGRVVATGGDAGGAGAGGRVVATGGNGAGGKVATGGTGAGGTGAGGTGAGGTVVATGGTGAGGTGAGGRAVGTGGTGAGGRVVATGGAGGGGTGTSGVACTTTTDCASLSAPDPAMMCSPRWSCVQGACFADCNLVPRSCTLQNGCVTCTSEPPGSDSRTCSTEACRRPFAGSTPPQGGTAACGLPAPNPTTWTCFGEWVLLPDGTLCTVVDIATGLPRFLLTCGVCHWVYQG